MALRSGYYGVKRFLRDKLETIAGTYDETIKSLFSRSEQAVLGAVNVLAPNWKTGVGSGITFTVNSDYTVTANGTASGDNTFIIPSPDMPANTDLILNGCPSGGSGTTFFMQYTNEIDTAYNDFGNGVAIRKFNYSTYNNSKVVIKIKSGQTVNNLVFKPMISCDGGEFVPFAMTNKELTDSASDQKTAINAIITAATGAADFAAFKTAIGAITPVTRSLSLTKEDITEEVKEDVEHEKTVTKKRTTKKTEEV